MWVVRPRRDRSGAHGGRLDGAVTYIYVANKSVRNINVVILRPPNAARFKTIGAFVGRAAGRFGAALAAKPAPNFIHSLYALIRRHWTYDACGARHHVVRLSVVRSERRDQFKHRRAPWHRPRRDRDQPGRHYRSAE